MIRVSFLFATRLDFFDFVFKMVLVFFEIEGFGGGSRIASGDKFVL